MVNRDRQLRQIGCWIIKKLISPAMTYHLRQFFIKPNRNTKLVQLSISEFVFFFLKSFFQARKNIIFIFYQMREHDLMSRINSL